MGDDEKAKKLLAARKKLKEYQSRQNAADNNNTKSHEASAKHETALSNASGSIASNLSERSESELNLHDSELKLTENVNVNEVKAIAKDIPNIATAEQVIAKQNEFTNVAANATPIVGNYFVTAEDVTPLVQPNQIFEEPQQNINTLQVLINEKAQLTTELTKFRSSYREKDLELEEVRTQFLLLTKRHDEMQQRFVEQQHSVDQLRRINAELQHKLAQANATNEDQATHLNELQKQLNQMQTKVQELDQQYKDKTNKLEMAQLRIQQLTDESSLGKDNRVETLTQTQFMYEQQIRDLQAMVQQLTQDKEQANVQYQNYVQHLNTEIGKIQTKYSDQTDEYNKLQERERELIEHVSSLEREIQKKIQQTQSAQSDENKQESSSSSNTELNEKIEKLEEKLSDFNLERHEFQLKIKSQDDHLAKLSIELQQKQIDMEQLQTQLEHLNAEKPDTSKLLATMESDKIAASRAVAQNIELKKQLDELELRFVQLTNDKADLMIKFDAETYANREMHQNYAKMEAKLQTSDERFKFKDEEMIRLSNENMELTRNNLILQQQIDRLKHYEVERYNETYNQPSDKINEEIISEHEHEHENEENQHKHQQHYYNNRHLPHDHAKEKQNDHAHHHDHHHHHHHHEHHDQHHNHLHADHEEHCHDNNHDNHQHDKENSANNNLQSNSSKICEIASEANEDPSTKYAFQSQRLLASDQLASEEAVKKLQQRFTHLISQVADLTDEKQHLEHLVLQLQSETETIGEYIALYQRQRRILKQREYEKAAQMQLLQVERQQLHEKIALLNNLVTSLGLELPPKTTLQEHLNAALTESVSIEPPADEHQQLITPLPESIMNAQKNDFNLKINSTESQKQIIAKIQDIITEMKENTKEIPTITNSVDHLNCCFGKFEVV